MTSREQTGKTVDEAAQAALEELGVTADQVEVEVVDEGSRGLLGLGHAPARVKVTVRDASADPSIDNTPEAGPKTKATNQPAREATMEAPLAMEQSANPTIAELAEQTKDTLQHILDGIGSGGSAEVSGTSDDQIDISVSGGDSAVLIGKKGQTINAIQYLLSVMVNRHLQNRVRVSVDVEGYRGRREEALKNQARYLADQVKESGQEAVLESLDASERRIIHTSLADDPDVYTYSEGHEPERYVVISPRK